MRNFFKNPSHRKQNTRNGSVITGRRFMQEVLDTDEDRVTNRYNVYREYINNISKNVLQGNAMLNGRGRITAN